MRQENKEMMILEEMLRRERNRLAGMQTYSMEEIDKMADEILGFDEKHLFICR